MGMCIFDIVSAIEDQLIVPILSEAFKVLQLLGGLALWIMIIMVIVKALESKLGPTGWARAAALWDLFSNFKWLIVTLIGLYITVYSVAYIANYLTGQQVVNPGEFASGIIYQLFFGPFIELWKAITPTP